MSTTTTGTDADVIVVGGGPGGAATAWHAARQGLHVLVLEKSDYPREKVCGDGLTPRSVRQLQAMGIDVWGSGWARNRGLRIIGGGVTAQIDWPDLATYPDYGLTRTRMDFDEILVRAATGAGAKLHTSTTVTAPLVDEGTDRVVGVHATYGPDKEPRTYRARLVVAADGVSGRFPVALGLAKRPDRPMGVAVRRYYRSPRHHDDYLESWLELRGKDGASTLLPGYGWIFGMGDGRVNVGLGVLSSANHYGKLNYRELLLRWLGGTPDEWGLSDEANADGPIMGAALPMGFNRVPHYHRGVMLVGDSGGMVNPFNGEGIAYAMESGALAAELAAEALRASSAARTERLLQLYPAELKARYGGYYRMGGWFVKLISRPELMRFATRHAMPRPALMRLTLKLLGNLTDPRGGDAADRVINALNRVVPAV